jgi:hypothetical protein
MNDARNDGLPVKRLSGRLLAVLLLGFFTLGPQKSAFAQAGSTGGTIGKQDKSVSGGNESAAARPLLPKPNLRPDLCGKMPGIWNTSVNSNLGALTIKSDGTMTQGVFSGTWTCDTDVFNATWYGNATKCTISRNARQFSCGSSGVARRQDGN